MNNKPTLIFVYNADTGLFNTLTDMAHKALSPSTYACNLCRITYSNFGMRKEWEEFVKSLDRKIEFIHRNELEEQYGIADVKLPAIFEMTDQGVTEWINADALNSCQSMDDLKQLVTSRLS